MRQKRASWHSLLLLILAGESIFILPFVLPRIFRATVLDIFQLNNIQLGLCFSTYGVVAMLSYLFGGPISDKFAPRKLIATALWTTALGGIVYANFPNYTTLKILYGYWGFTTIFLLWSPLIKATRIWGGENYQGKAFGFLDGGRGLIGALFGSIGLFIFSLFISSKTSEIPPQQTKIAFQYVVYICIGLISLVGILIWFFMKTDIKREQEISQEKITLSQVKEVLRLPSVWLLMLIILCAYVGYKITDIFSLYAKEVMLYNELQAAQVGTILLYIRPLIGIIIGLLANRAQTIKWLIGSFILSSLGAILFISGIISSTTTTLFFISTLTVASGVYATRSLYFAIMENGQIPIVLTGTAVGIISIVGYTPDIFSGPMIGYFLDHSPGKEGHIHVFWLLGLFSTIGILASWFYLILNKKKNINL